MNNGGNMYDFRNDLNNNRNYNPYNQNMNMYNQQYSEPRKKRGGGLFTFLLLLIIVFLVLYIVDIKEIYDIPYMDKVDDFISSKFVKPADDGKEDKKEEKTATEENITEQKTKDELINKVLFLSTLDATPSQKTTIFAKDLKVEDLSDEQKIRLAAYGLNAVEDKYVPVTSQEELTEIFPDLPAEQTENIRSITATSVSNRYQGLFGTKPEYKSITEGCPTFIYSSKNSKYYLNSNCSIAADGSVVTNEMIHLFAYKFSKDDTHEYVYVSIGVSKIEEDEATIYLDYEAENEFKKITKEELENFQITESDYKSFAKYKFTFTKNESANYVFEKVEKVKEN